VTAVLSVLDGLVCLILIVLVLLHSGKGGGLSDMLGGGGAAALGSTAAERNLNRITFVVALLFAFLTVALGLRIN
jgi:preprotein translocase subunit SecG